MFVWIWWLPFFDDFFSYRVYGKDSLVNEIDDTNVIVFVVIGDVLLVGDAERFEVDYICRRRAPLFYKSCFRETRTITRLKFK